MSITRPPEECRLVRLRFRDPEEVETICAILRTLVGGLELARAPRTRWLAAVSRLLAALAAAGCAGSFTFYLSAGRGDGWLLAAIAFDSSGTEAADVLARGVGCEIARLADHVGLDAGDARGGAGVVRIGVRLRGRWRIEPVRLTRLLPELRPKRHPAASHWTAAAAQLAAWLRRREMLEERKAGTGRLARTADPAALSAP